MNCTNLILCLFLLTVSTTVRSQEEVTSGNKLTSFPTHFLSQLQKKTTSLEARLLTKSQKALQQLAKQEARLKKQLAKMDSAQAEILFGNVDQKYQQLQQQLSNPIDKVSGAGEYFPNLDTLTTSLKFLSAHSSLLPNGQALTAPVKNALRSVSDLQGRIQQTEKIQQYLRERQQLLNNQLNRFGLAKGMKKYRQQAYYYKQQIQEYKNILEDPSRLQAQAIALVQKLPAFQQFMREHSQLASLFRLPGNYAIVMGFSELSANASGTGFEVQGGICVALRKEVIGSRKIVHDL